jgi:hypothetical protein
MVEKIKVTKVRILKRFFINFIRVGVAFFNEGGRFLGGDKIFSSDRFLEFFIQFKITLKRND